jgi:hypothetical protein
MKEDARKNERGFCYATRSALGYGKLGKSCLPATAVGLRKLGRARPIGLPIFKKSYSHTHAPAVCTSPPRTRALDCKKTLLLTPTTRMEGAAHV